MKYYALLIALLLFFDVNNIFAYSGGDGSSGNPYQISDADDIEELMGDSGNWDKYFIVIADIDCASYSWTSGYPKPIGNPTGGRGSGPAFSGYFDGNNHKILSIYSQLLTHRKQSFRQFIKKSVIGVRIFGLCVVKQ
jgi:hypothetical protein